MIHRLRSSSSVVAVCFVACTTAPPPEVKEPVEPKKPERPAPLPDGTSIPSGTTVYGSYGDGCLLVGAPFEPRLDAGFKAAFTIGYYVAHPQMHDMLTTLGRAYRARFDDAQTQPILLSDISHEGGGQLLPHRSHQVGLDVDLFFFSNLSEPRDLVDTGQGVSSDFDLARNWWLASKLAIDARVDRIFVAAEVKKSFCEKRAELAGSPAQKVEVLRRLRPWFGHRDHFHVRMSCPRGEPFCYNPAGPIDPGDGCHEVDAWLLDPKHAERRAQTDYLAPKKFNVRCHRPSPNEIAHPVKEASSLH